MTSSDFLLSSDLQEFRTSLRAFLEKEFTPTALRNTLKDSEEQKRFREALSPKLTELGIYLAGAPESAGGLGAGLSASVMVAEECARALIPVSYFELLAYSVTPLSVISSSLLEQEALTAGEDLSACLRGDCFLSDGKVSGTAKLISGDVTSGTLLILTKESGGGNLVSVPTSELTFTPVDTIDLLRPFFTAQLQGVVPNTIIPLNSDAVRFIDSAHAVLASAEIVGCAEKVLSMTVDYVKTRKQFGSPIGSFQAVQHKLAEIQLAVDASQSLLRFAAWSADNDREQFFSAASGVKAFVSEQLPRAIEGCLQAHGGIGFTWEYDLHLYLRRAVLMSTLYGTASSHAELLGSQALL